MVSVYSTELLTVIVVLKAHKINNALVAPPPPPPHSFMVNVLI